MNVSDLPSGPARRVRAGSPAPDPVYEDQWLTFTRREVAKASAQGAQQGHRKGYIEGARAGRFAGFIWGMVLGAALVGGALALGAAL